ncbi:CU044_5270 family protein [Streptomyces sp. YKOK-I1]
MNEMNEPAAAVRALRADAPLPDSDRLAPGRALLCEAFQQDARPAQAPARPAPRRRILLVAAAAGALAVTGALVSTLPDDAAEAPATASPAPGRQVLSARASADTLELAAATVQRLGAAEPGPKQWVYKKETSLGSGGSTTELWTRWDGFGEARLPGLPHTDDLSTFDPDKLQVSYGPPKETDWRKNGYDDRSQRAFYRFLATLPSDPDRMMAAIRKERAFGDFEGETRAQRDWREISILYGSVLIPPNAQAGLFRALARIPGAQVEKGIEDPIGRPAIGVTVNYVKAVPSGYQGKQELYFDPETYAYLGEKAHLPSAWNTTESGPSMPPRSLDVVTVRDAWGVVDKPGERP